MDLNFITKLVRAGITYLKCWVNGSQKTISINPDNQDIDLTVGGNGSGTTLACIGDTNTVYIGGTATVSGLTLTSRDKLMVRNAGTDTFMSYICFSDNSSSQDYVRLNIYKSNSDTEGVAATTDDGDILGWMGFLGVDTTPGFDNGAYIYAVQNGASGTKVPTDLIFYTSTNSLSSLVLKLGTDLKVTVAGPIIVPDAGSIGLGSGKATITFNDEATDDVTISDANTVCGGTLSFTNTLYITDDIDTKFYNSSTVDTLNLDVGGVVMLGLIEDGTQDYFKINPANADVDTLIGASGGTAITVLGSDKNVTFGGNIGIGANAVSTAKILSVDVPANDTATKYFQWYTYDTWSNEISSIHDANFTHTYLIFNGSLGGTLASPVITAEAGGYSGYFKHHHNGFDIGRVYGGVTYGTLQINNDGTLDVNYNIIAAENILMSSTKYIGLSAAGRLVFADATPDTITVTSANLVLEENLIIPTSKYLGIASNKGRFVFVDTTVDTITVTDADFVCSGNLNVAGNVTDGSNTLTVANIKAAYDHKTTEDAINGLVKCNGSGTYSAVTDNSSNWNTAYGWGNHSGLYTPIAHKTTEDALNGLVKCDGAGTYSAVTDSSSNWNTAYGWGNHASGGYFVKASDDLDDISEGTTNKHLTVTLKSNYDAAYSHKTTEDAISGLVKCNGAGTYSAVTDSSSNWNTAYGWGNHASAGYFVKASDDLDDITEGTTNKHLTATLKSNYDAAYSHVSNNGSDHSYINQSVTSSASPAFAGLTVNGDVSLVSVDAGATGGPTIDLYRNSASPAINDIIGSIEFNGNRNDGSTKEYYAGIEGFIAGTQPPPGRGGGLDFYAQDDGSTVKIMRLMGAATDNRIYLYQNVFITDGKFIGLGLATGRFIFTDSSPDIITASTCLLVSSNSAANADNEAFRIQNTDSPATTEVGQSVSMTFYGKGSEDGGGTFIDAEFGYITGGKDSDYFCGSACTPLQDDWDGNLQFGVNISGTPTEVARMTSTKLLKLQGNLSLPVANSIYFSNDSVAPSEGDWRIDVNGNDLVFERYESSAWVEKGAFTAA